MKTHNHTNRYGDKFTFTLQPDGNILWEGNFKYIRWGHPNDYTQAWENYQKEGHGLTYDEFIKEIHHFIYDDNGKYVGPSEIAGVYGKQVASRLDIINMVDPSGGPYLAEGMEFMGKTIKEFKTHGESYLIITENETKED